MGFDKTSLFSNSSKVEVSSLNDASGPFMNFAHFFIHGPTKHYPYQRAITELRIDIRIHDYFSLLLVHVGIISCKYIKLLTDFF